MAARATASSTTACATSAMLAPSGTHSGTADGTAGATCTTWRMAPRTRASSTDHATASRAFRDPSTPTTTTPVTSPTPIVSPSCRAIVASQLVRLACLRTTPDGSSPISRGGGGDCRLRPWSVERCIPSSGTTMARDRAECPKDGERPGEVPFGPGSPQLLARQRNHGDVRIR